MSTATLAPAKTNETAQRERSMRKESLTRKGWNAFDVWQDRVRRAAEAARSAGLEGRPGPREPSSF
jgi:hypothetical protein